MMLPPVLDPICREFLGSQNDMYCKNTVSAWTVQGIAKINMLQVFMSRENEAHNRPH